MYACAYACLCELRVDRSKSLERCVVTMTFTQPSSENQNGAFIGSLFAARITKEPKLVCQLLMTCANTTVQHINFKNKILIISSLLSALDLS